MELEELLEISRRALKRYALCDRCLGRLYARLGHGWDNLKRGSAVKTMLVMKYHSAIMLGDRDAEREFLEIAPRIGYIASGLYKRIAGSDLASVPCAICNGSLDLFLEALARKAIDLLRSWGISRFLVGVIVENTIRTVEAEVIKISGTKYYEELKDEISRELGKKIEEYGGFTADLRDPEATILVGYPSGEINIEARSILIRARYWKKWRMISQSIIIRNGKPKHFSIQEASRPLADLFMGAGTVVHAFGREDIDARMLGTGRGVVIEVKSPRRRRASLGEVEEFLNRFRDLVEFKVLGYSSRWDVRVNKKRSNEARKIYRILALVGREIREEDIRRLEDELRDRDILQRTPSRALYRRSDKERIKHVYEVRCVKIAGNLLECLLEASGGLYIKELVSGDGGRTRPSFSEILRTEAICIELDVVWTEL
ncbi:MAG: tRNA pseudouridine(54/55) synthase Pus10 [Desulfurococcales archaeon]|jgi:tRNA pseudouridine synthase 10|nr:tRNA pseudouridine(54/55) synthase Pus10 [Desulfurococcales archaeon]